MEISLCCKTLNCIHMYIKVKTPSMLFNCWVYKARISHDYRFAVFSPMSVVHSEVVNSANCIWLSYRDITFKNYYKFDMIWSGKWKL